MHRHDNYHVGAGGSKTTQSSTSGDSTPESSTASPLPSLGPSGAVSTVTVAEGNTTSLGGFSTTSCSSDVTSIASLVVTAVVFDDVMVMSSELVELV